MYISASSASQIDRMNVASQRVKLGHIIESLQSASATFQGIIGASGSYALVGTDITASRVAITTGMTSVHGLLTQTSRSGSPLDGYVNAIAGSTAGVILVQKNTASGSALLAGDVVTWMAF
jgi:hypothetical protein